MIVPAHVLPDITGPTPVVDLARVQTNIRRMAEKAKSAQVAFRPHFKTHQSLAIGRMFRDEGVDAITVSSVAMAEAFAADGWRDILIAFPFNPLEIERINRIPLHVTLHLLADHRDTIAALKNRLSRPAGLYIKIDTGYGRAGIRWNRPEELAAVLFDIEAPLTLTGLLTHAGHAYHAADPVEVQKIVNKTCRRMISVKACMAGRRIQLPVLSIGNTPGCVIARQFPEMDEIRPGNFVFFDLMQWHASICHEKELAMAVVCPVCGIYPDRGELVVAGGAVHFSKERLDLADGPCYGMGVTLSGSGLGDLQPDIRIVALSQEHGVVRVPELLLDSVRVGDRMAFVPVHSCLTADLYPAYRTPDGKVIQRINSVTRRGESFIG